jgi:hypothetical protein
VDVDEILAVVYRIQGLASRGHPQTLGDLQDRMGTIYELTVNVVRGTGYVPPDRRSVPAPAADRQWNVGYRILSSQQRGTVAEGVVLLKAPSERDARQLAGPTITSLPEFDPRIDPYFQIDYVDEVEGE